MQTVSKWERALATSHERVRQYLERLRELHKGEDLAKVILPSDEDISPRVGNTRRIDQAAVERRWNLLQAAERSRPQLLDPQTTSQMPSYAQNIENFIGTVKVPVGLAGPLRVHGLNAHGDYYIPLATTEAALVASFTRGCQVISDAGGCTSIVVNEGVGRSPVFVFDDVKQAGQFVIWVTENLETIRGEAEATTRHGKLVDVRLTLEGNHVYLLLEYITGDAAGQNMVTIATEAVCRFIERNSPVRPRRWYVEGNMSGDKKAASQSFQGVRGKKVIAEAVVPADLVQRKLHCTPAQMVQYYRVSSVGGVISGNIGIQGHYANGLAAMYIACGQDAACVAESAVGITRFEKTDEGGLYVTVTLPNLIVGTVGGGTGLPSQRACLEILGLAGDGKATAFAEVCAALVLAGEISIIAALAAGQFTHAHQKLARGGAT